MFLQSPRMRGVVPEVVFLADSQYFGYPDMHVTAKDERLHVVVTGTQGRLRLSVAFFGRSLVCEAVGTLKRAVTKDAPGPGLSTFGELSRPVGAPLAPNFGVNFGLLGDTGDLGDLGDLGDFAEGGEWLMAFGKCQRQLREGPG
eukprot:CAMPEP_0194502134 /NCGR_PEP_ID=MMETSP0253-20130528/24540_1 /TAXON_ID=2966 /ORGANISM="Noctiluca scintillans" /LENGTH=143 /DNA_ID=CAMNT_0039344231 /DNA_START=135 /DNA_END=563 /DNA_ORIENTATION=+